MSNENENGSIHINIDADLPSPSSNRIPAIHTNENSFHTMFNRVRQFSPSSNLNNVLSPNGLRSLISNSNISSFQGFQPSQTRQSGFRYTPLVNQSSVIRNPAENVHIDEHQSHEHIENPSNILRTRLEHDSLNNRLDPDRQRSHARLDGSNTSAFDANPHEDRVPTDATRQEARSEEENNNNNNVNMYSDILIRFLGNFVRYLPFLIILFVKFIHDHLPGILDITILQIVIWFVDKSLTQQVSKLSQKNILILMRDMGLVAATVTYRILLSPSSLDPFGLLINPPAETITMEISSDTSAPSMENSPTLNLLKKYLSSPNLRATVEAGSALYVTKAISLGLLLYYVVVNDLILKLLTILTKIIITMMPGRLLRHNQRARLYAVVEYISQLYRSLVPLRQWGKFLFESYTGLEVISGILLSAFYMGAKGLECISRGKTLQQALLNFLDDMDYERKPTRAELEAAGQNCPICHDTYNTPVILTCNHIFCDDCVGQWFKREQTCPMCRAVVSEDPNWQDGSTTFFYQLC